MNKKILIIAGLLVGLTLIFWAFRGTGEEDAEIAAEVKFGDFVIEVTSSGELQAKSSIKITCPSTMQNAEIYQATINDLVPEGTIVKKGDYVARLDESAILEKINKKMSDYQQSESKYIQVQLDTTMELRKARDELINLEYEVRQKKLVVEQSKFEPPANQQQAQIELEKAERAYKQAKQNYKLLKRKARARMQEATAKLNENKAKLDFLQNLQQDFTILAPETGMVIYEREWDGTKRQVGSVVNIWDNVVATLPDLSRMLSRTYVSEVDIRVVKVGQPVKVSLDAYPDKQLTGKVVSVANIGEQRPNTDGKVFQVDIEINESDSTLRPAMTTGNTIIAEVIKDVLFVPLEALHSQGDTLTYVLKKDGFGYHRQQVITGKSNADEVIIEQGLQQGDRVLLSDPKDFEKMKLELLAENQ